jgi:hypothetical protein
MLFLLLGVSLCADITVPTPRFPDPALVHPWPADDVALLEAKARRVIAAHAGKIGVTTADEREKHSMLATILAGLAGDTAAAGKALMTPDADLRSNAWTQGIDFYYAFTLKGQVVTYFFCGDWLDPAYRERMRQGAAAWTATDPRPSLEYVGALDSSDPAVAAYARDALAAMWRDPAAVRAMADVAASEDHPNKTRFAAYMRRFAEVMPQTMPTDHAGWRRWLTLLTDDAEIDRIAGEHVHAFLVFEEYERRVNPNPHPVHGIGSGPVGTVWAPRVRGMRTDARNTDNLRAMRDVAVYLFAEETGNAVVRDYYRHRLLATARTYWSMGNGEWDSMAYLGHLHAAWCNLYSFAKDPAVRRAGLAVLDLLSVSAARRYWNNAWCGPLARDYGDIGTGGDGHSCGAAGYFSYFFAESVDGVATDADLLMPIIAGYRPPWAVVQLARRRGPVPREEWAAQPAYETWLPQNTDQPAYHETTTYGRGWQMGSLAEGSGGDLNGFKILVDRPGRVPATISAAGGPGRNPVISQAPGERIAQRGNALLWLARVPELPPGKDGVARTWAMQFLVPADLPRVVVDGWWVVDGGGVWVAIQPQGAQGDPAQAGGATTAKGKAADTVAQTIRATAAGPGFAGFALAIGDVATHGTRAAFLAGLSAAPVDAAALASGTLAWSPPGAGAMAVTWTDAGPPQISHDGVPVDWSARRAHWAAAPGSPEAVHLGWKTGALRVCAGNTIWTASVDLGTGAYSWSASP